MEAAEYVLTHFCSQVSSRGTENIPEEGPLLVVSNHPGAYDSAVIFSKLTRKDIKWVASDIPFLKILPNTNQYQFTAPKTGVSKRASVMRDAIGHLKEGGALLYFGAGHMDYDPEVWKGASGMIDKWIEGADFFFRHVPGLNIQPTFVSGVISPKWARSKITWLRKKEMDKYRLMMFAQVIFQLLFPKRLMVSPSISFGKPFTLEELMEESRNGNSLPAIIAREKALMTEHCLAYGIPLRE
jgi:hypothetical protein